MTFPGVKALDNVDFTLRKGEIHALMGENGAGKSTLIKCLTGINDFEAGEIRVEGVDHPVKNRSTMDAQKIGISTVYQEVNLCPNLTVAENLYIGREPMTALRTIDRRRMIKQADELVKRLDIKVDVTQNLENYSLAIQQMIAIARAVDMDCKVLILDEPTSSLDDNEVEKLFKLMNQLKANGVGIVFVTHFLEQVYEVCDRITVSESVIMGMLMALDGSLALGYTRKDFIRIAYRVATEYCGISIRLRDLITVSYAQPGKVFHFDLQSSSYELMDYPFMNSEDPRGGGLYAIIVDPSLPPQILRDEIEEKRADAHECCRELRKHLPEDYTLRTYPVNDLKSHIIRDLDEHVRHTCEYVISETRYVERARQAILDADGRMFARCLSNIYIGMRDVFDVTCPEVDWLIRRAGEVDGVYGACYVSNGDSGSIFMVLDRKGEQDFVRCMDDYKRIFDFRAKTRPFMPGGPAHVVREVE